MNKSPQIPVSWGELIDKITILEIKRERLTGPAALANVGRELEALSQIADPVLADDETARDLKTRLKAVNEILWEIEDRIRDKGSGRRIRCGIRGTGAFGLQAQ